jgi:hypothetical protein
MVRMIYVQKKNMRIIELFTGVRSHWCTGIGLYFQAWSLYILCLIMGAHNGCRCCRFCWWLDMPTLVSLFLTVPIFVKNTYLDDLETSILCFSNNRCYDWNISTQSRAPSTYSYELFLFIKFIYELVLLQYAWLQTYYAHNADFHLFLIKKQEL